MNQDSDRGKIASGFDVWMQANQRAASKKVELGNWWRLGASYWRVSWLETTGELFASERESDRFILLTQLSKQELKLFMNKWFDGDNLGALVQRFDKASA